MKIVINAIYAELVDTSTLTGEEFLVKCWKIDYTVIINYSKFNGTLGVNTTFPFNEPAKIINYIKNLYLSIEQQLSNL